MPRAERPRAPEGAQGLSLPAHPRKRHALPEERVGPLWGVASLPGDARGPAVVLGRILPELPLGAEPPQDEMQGEVVGVALQRGLQAPRGAPRVAPRLQLRRLLQGPLRAPRRGRGPGCRFALAPLPGGCRPRAHAGVEPPPRRAPSPPALAPGGRPPRPPPPRHPRRRSAAAPGQRQGAADRGLAQGEGLRRREEPGAHPPAQGPLRQLQAYRKDPHRDPLQSRAPEQGPAPLSRVRPPQRQLRIGEEEARGGEGERAAGHAHRGRELQKVQRGEREVAEPQGAPVPQAVPPGGGELADRQRHGDEDRDLHQRRRDHPGRARGPGPLPRAPERLHRPPQPRCRALGSLAPPLPVPRRGGRSRGGRGPRPQRPQRVHGPGAQGEEDVSPCARGGGKR